MEVASDFGLMVSVPKTKLMVSSRQATTEDKTPIAAGKLTSQQEMNKLRVSVMSSSGRVQPDMDKRIA